MKILLVNKFLFRAGGCENYMINLGEELLNRGHQVEYFGISSQKNIVGNSYGIYVKSYEEKKIYNPLSIVYNREAKKKMEEILTKFQPDIVHMNNISYHLTSSIIDACKELNVPVIMTIHDPQLVCPNHMLYRFDTKEICNECLEMNSFKPCIKHKCIKGSKIKSVLAYLESNKTHNEEKYKYVSKYICPSDFIKSKLLQGNYDQKDMIVLRNFIYKASYFTDVEKENYILYFGRLSEEKGLDILLKALPDNVNLLIAGSGPYEEKIKELNQHNVQYIGFKTGEELQRIINKALFTVYPSKWYENCPLSISESISLGTPVIATNEGGIPELIDDGINGLLFENQNVEDLKDKIHRLIKDEILRKKMYENCSKYSKVPDVNEYIEQLEKIYEECINHAKNN